jgi:hypothetical protein
MNKKFVYQVGSNKKVIYYAARPTKYQDLKWLCFKVWIVHEMDCITNAWHAFIILFTLIFFVFILFWLPFHDNSVVTFSVEGLER